MLQPQPQSGDKSGRITLVLGGARSGKSRYAQQLASQAGRVTFIATAQARGDEEMEQRIARHIADRPAAWQTNEEPLELASAITGAATNLILVDCLSFYVANLLERFDEDHLIQAAFEHLLQAIANTSSQIVLVANEVGSGVVPEYLSGRRFRDLAGELNQRTAAVADRVVLMIAGLPLVLKGAQS